MLTLYRRHTKSCSHGYPQNKRILPPRTKRERAADCVCPIAAEGKLSKAGRITNRSLKTSDWKEAQETAEKWQEWGSTVEPLPQDVSVQYAVSSFLTSQGPQGRNVEASTFAGFQVLLNQRLLPFAKTFAIIRAFDNLDTVTKFVESWRNLQDGTVLANSSKKKELEKLRFFFNYCVDRGWMTTNPAKKIRLSFETAKKFGLSPDEEHRLFDAIQNQELRAFCLTMRLAGLRISDATTLEEAQLVTRASGNGWAINLFQKKTKEWVYIPIPDQLAEVLRALPLKDGKHWFWSGNGNPEDTSDNWYHKMKAVVEKCNFSRPVTPHTLRHTFCISHLNAGVDLKFVSRWCGHKSIAITEKHYAHAVHGTLIASDHAYDASVKRAVAMTASA